MNSLRNFVLFCIGILIFAAMSSMPWAEEAALSQLHNFLQYKTFKSTFSQKVWNEDKVLLEHSSGVFILKRPGHFRWEYTNAGKQLIIADGLNLVTYDPELEQATTQPLAATPGYSPIVLLLQGKLALEKFEISQAEHREGLDWLALTPKVQDIEFARIEVGLKNQQVIKIKMLDQFNQVTAIEFLDGEYNISLDKNAFRLRLPPGTDIIGEYLVGDE